MARSASLDGFRMSRPGGYAGIMLLFLGIIGIFVWIQQEFVLDFFDNNATLNGMILGVLAFGILYCFAQVLGLGSSARWVEQIRLRDPGRSSAGRSVPSLLAPMAAMLRDPQGPMELSPFAMRSILDSIGTRLDESRENSRYMIGLLIFLGLLGTFWGLLQTIGAVGDTVSNLTPDGSAGSNIFEQLKTGLEAPLQGMGLAFSTSLFGLSGSLILGFLDLQAAQAQNRFYNELEEFLSTRTTLTGDYAGAIPVYSGGEGSPKEMAQLLRAINRLEQTIARGATRTAPRLSSDGALSAAPDDLKSTMTELHAQLQREEDAVLRLGEQQAKMEPVLARLADSAERLANGQTAVFEEIRDHLRHMDGTITDLAAVNHAVGNGAAFDDLRSDVKALRALIASLADEQGQA